jgi:hypothetical protein
VESEEERERVAEVATAGEEFKPAMVSKAESSS